MEELKLLAEMVSSLPAMALWVIAFFFGYKVIVVGSIYGVIRFVAQKAYDAIAAYQLKPINREARVRDISISDAAFDELLSELRRIKNKGLATGSGWIHSSDINWLRKAIDAQEVKDREAKK